MFIRAYLRASTEDQNADRAREELNAFAKAHGQQIACYYTENVSGTKLDRPELNRLLSDAQDGDVLLLEQVDRLTRLKDADWKNLKRRIEDKGLSVVSLDLPTSHQALTQQAQDGFTGAMLKAINAMLLDMLAAIARKDYDDRRRRQAQGIEAAKKDKKYAGRKPDTKLHDLIIKLRGEDRSLNEIAALAGCSKATVCRVLSDAKEAQA